MASNSRIKSGNAADAKASAAAQSNKTQGNSSSNAGQKSPKSQTQPVFQFKKDGSEKDSGSIWARLEPTNLKPQT